jgi:hypothetical protein
LRLRLRTRLLPRGGARQRNRNRAGNDEGEDGM